MKLRRFACAVLTLGLFPFGLLAASRSGQALSLSGSGLTAGEKYVLEQVVAGKSADLRQQFGEGTNSVLRGAFVEALLCRSGTNIHRNGVDIDHAVIRDAINLRNATVGYEVSFSECTFEAEVNLSLTAFEKTVSLTGCTFRAPVNFSAMKVGRIATFDRTTFESEVKAGQLEVTGVLSMREAHFKSPTNRVDFSSLNAVGDAFFTKATFAGPVTFQFAHIAENWRCEGCAFTHAKALVNFEAVQVGATTSFEESSFAGYVSFKDARFATLDLANIQWPGTHGDQPWLWLNGMTYRQISAGAEKDSWKNIYALVQSAAHRSGYSANIYAGLEDYYRRLGYPDQANIFFRAQKQREREEVLTGFQWTWSLLLDWFVGYGRSPQRAIFWSVAIVVFGCFVFRPDRMEPQNPGFNGRKFSPFWYSVDLYVPVIKLQDAETWKPKEDYAIGNVWRRIHTVLGWALIPIAIAVWTGMVDR